MTFQNPGAAGAEAAKQELRLERSILTNELQQLESTRRALTSQLEKSDIKPADRVAISNQLADINRQIATVDNMLSRTQSQMVGGPQAITVAPAPPVMVHPRPMAESFGYVLLLWAAILVPLSFALSKRILRGTRSPNAPVPPALDERLARMEQMIEATAIEVERIGEGQRFVTRLLTESQPARVLESARETVSRP